MESSFISEVNHGSFQLMTSLPSKPTTIATIYEVSILVKIALQCGLPFLKKHGLKSKVLSNLPMVDLSKMVSEVLSESQFLDTTLLISHKQPEEWTKFLICSQLLTWQDTLWEQALLVILIKTQMIVVSQECMHTQLLLLLKWPIQEGLSIRCSWWEILGVSLDIQETGAQMIEDGHHLWNHKFHTVLIHPHPMNLVFSQFQSQNLRGLLMIASLTTKLVTIEQQKDTLTIGMTWKAKQTCTSLPTLLDILPMMKPNRNFRLLFQKREEIFILQPNHISMVLSQKIVKVHTEFLYCFWSSTREETEWLTNITLSNWPIQLWLKKVITQLELNSLWKSSINGGKTTWEITLWKYILSKI